MIRMLAIPALASIAALTLLTACSTTPSPAPALTVQQTPSTPAGPFMAQVVGVKWLNPLQRRDYPTEWQLLWTLGLAKPNKDDDMVRSDPDGFSTLQYVASVAYGNKGSETFEGYHHKYVMKLIVRMHDIYFSSSTYFYNAHSLTDKSTRREFAGLHVEYALPQDRLDPVEAADFVRKTFVDTFSIGSPNFPTAWTSATPPDIRVTMGGTNAGFTSLAAALDYLQAHPDQTVWAMNWDAPAFPPNDMGLNENMALLVLAGPGYKTERAALAWIGYPASRNKADFQVVQDKPRRIVQAWQATLADALANAGKEKTDIGYVIHDANNQHADSGDRLASLAYLLASEVPEFDFARQTFNTSALLGEMGAGTALTNVALAIGYANHVGKNVLVAGTTDPGKSTAVLVVPPAKVRPVDHEKPWFRARSESKAYLMWWGLRHDAPDYRQGYSE